MIDFKYKRDKKLFETLAILKFIYMLLGIGAILSSLIIKRNYNFIIKDLIFMMFILTTYLIGMFATKERCIHNEIKFKNIIETFLLISVCTIVIIFTGKEESPFKFLYIFIIIISAIQFGRRYTSFIAITCSFLVCIFDFFSINFKTYINCANKIELIKFLQTDIVIISVFFVTSWVLGMYVNIEKEHTKKLQNLANIDELTGLYNHRYFQESLDILMECTRLEQTTMSMLFIDIDYFKVYNDLNGHQAGDLALRKVGEILKNSIRENDIVARYGGEEFAVLLPNTSEEDAIIIGERIRDNVDKYYFYGQENQPNNNVTLSIGVSSYPLKSDSKYHFINTADDALYRAKSLGKNRVELYYSLLEEVSGDVNLDKDTSNSLKRFINMINKKDKYTYGHIERVIMYLGWFSNHLKLNETDKLNLKVAGFLHDIGKFDISEEILRKKGNLTDVEFNILKNHPIKGVNLIKHIKCFENLLPVIKHHHERYDGNGYPDKLKGDEIPYLARMISIVDYFDSMTHGFCNSHNYNNYNEAINELRKCSGSKFDPELVENFINMIELKYN